MTKRPRLDNTAVLATIYADSDSDHDYQSESESDSESDDDDHEPLIRLVQNPGLHHGQTC